MNNMPAHQSVRALGALRNSKSRFLRFIGTLFYISIWAVLIVFALLVVFFLFLLVF